MIVYGHRSFQLDLPDFLRTFASRLATLPRAPSHDTIVDLVVDFGEVYAAALDALFPDRDDESEASQPWSEMAQALADALVASWYSDAHAVNRAIGAARTAIRLLTAVGDLQTVRVKPAEGFAFYSLYPEQYAIAADRWVRDRRCDALTCVGIRSIGAPLAHVVAAAGSRAGARTTVLTVRPRGHPFDRRLDVTERFRDRVAQLRDGWFAIVDEGPGLSGTSFAAAADALIAVGVDATRVVLFPSWCPPEGALRSDRGRQAIARYDKAVAPFADVFNPADAEDISAGDWRTRVLGDEEARWPAVHPQHERRKYLDRDRTHVMRFAGLGRYGRERHERAQALADGGFGAEPVELQRGFLTQRWIDGEPLLDGHPPIGAVADYLAFLRRTFATTERATIEDVCDMIRVNVREAFDAHVAATIDAMCASASTFTEPVVQIDGRLQRHEWIRDGESFYKVDALDHHDDDFFQGSRDIAWDVAGAIVEFALTEPAAGELAAQYARRGGDRTIAWRLPFYRAAYLCYRLGYVTLAVETLGDSADGRRFTALRTYYRHSLEALAAQHRSAPPR